MPASRTQVELRPEAFGDCTSCSISGTVRACKNNSGWVEDLGVQRLHKLQHQRHSSCLPEPSGSNKALRRSEIAQAALSAVQFERAKSTRVE